jgi:hypothetical protein
MNATTSSTQSSRRLILLAAAVVLLPVSAAAQALAPVITFTPERPVQGTLFTIHVANVAPRTIVTGVLAGEPLHFSPSTDSLQGAIGALPIDAADSAMIALRIDHANGVVDSLSVSIPIARGDYRLERLTVAPRFGTPPDSATQARIRSEQQRALAVSRNSHVTPRLRGASVVHPRDTRITSGFGHGREFNGQVQSRHMGTDFAGAVGAPIRAAARGVVALVDAFYLAGNVIYIDHGEGLVTAYFHLSRQDVAAGDTVDAGQVIGQVGATGRVTGPHLHWVVRYGLITVDPLSFLGLAQPVAAVTPPVRSERREAGLGLPPRLH